MANLKVTLDFATRSAQSAAKRASSVMSRSFKRVRTAVSRVSSAVGRMVKGMFSLRGAIIGAGAALAGALFTRASIRAAQAQEDAINKLNSALFQAGEYSKETSQELQSYASELQKVTRAGDEATLENLAFAMSLGSSSDQAKELVSGATDMAAALGVDAASATRQLSQTLSGQASTIGRLIPEVRDLSEEQLRNGAAIDLVREKFKGFAERDARTFSGRVQQLANNFGDLQEEIGFLVTKSPGFIAMVDSLSKGMVALQKVVRDNAAEFSALISGAFKGFISAAQLVVNATFSLIKGFKQLNGFIDDAGSRARIAQLRAEKKEIQEGGKVSGQVREDMLKGIDRMIQKERERGDEANVAMNKQLSALEQVEDQINSIADNMKSSFSDGELTSLFEGLGKGIEAEVESAAENSRRTLSNMLKGAISADEMLQKAGADPEKAKVEKSSMEALQAEIIPTIGKSLVESLVQGGKEGAEGFVQNAAAAAGQAFLGPMGQAAGPLVGLLTQGPEAVRETIQSFVDALPDVLMTIVESIPVLIEALIEAIPTLIQALVDSIPDLIDSLVDALPELVETLAREMPFIALTLMEAIIENLPQIISSFINYFINGIPDIIMALARGVYDAISNVLSSLTGGFLGFSEGGMVPAGFPNDSMPARVTSGEYVIDRGLTKKLNSALDSGGSLGGSQNDAMLSLILEELRTPQQIDTQFELEDRGFARAQLRMNKLNRRTSERRR